MSEWNRQLRFGSNPPVGNNSKTQQINLLIKTSNCLKYKFPQTQLLQAEKIATSALPMGKYIGRHIWIVPGSTMTKDAWHDLSLTAFYTRTWLMSFLHIERTGSDLTTFYCRLSVPALLSRTSGTENWPTTRKNIKLKTLLNKNVCFLLLRVGEPSLKRAEPNRTVWFGFSLST